MFKTMIALATAAAFAALLLAQAPPAPEPAKPGTSKAIQQRAQPPARIMDFRAQPASIQPGQSVTLIWATENPSTVNIAPDVGRVTPRGSRAVTPRQTTTYTLTVTGPPNNTTLTREVTVNVAGTTPRVLTSSATAVEPAETPRMPDGKPDFTGVYNFGGGGAGGAGRGGRGGGAPAGPELKPGKESYRVVRGPNEAGALADCMPVAGPAAFTVPYQFQLVQNKDYLIILHEYPNTHRIVPLNNASHPVDPDPTWLGDSIGRWEGDTLVVDTIGFNTRTEISGFKHSESLHIVERFRRPNRDTLEYEATLEDPEVFVRPWTVTRTFPLRGDLNKIDEFICENNKDYQHLFAK
jgi:hypothetical protein